MSIDWRTISPYDSFIETGCKDGDTLWQAKDLFPRCHSIEINADAHARCQKRFQNYDSVQVHLGDSRDVLPGIMNVYHGTMFYLDAHCEGSPSSVPEADTECPLRREVQIIVALPWIKRPMILIDDIHMLKPEYWTNPDSNHHLFMPNDWPRFDEIAALLGAYNYREDTGNRIGIWS